MKRFAFLSNDSYCLNNVLLISKLASNLQKKVLLVDMTISGFMNKYFEISSEPSSHIFLRDDIDICIGGLSEQDLESYDFVFYLLDDGTHLANMIGYGMYVFVTQDKIGRRDICELVRQVSAPTMCVILDKLVPCKIKPVMILTDLKKHFAGTYKVFQNRLSISDYTTYLNNVEQGVINLSSYSNDMKIFISELYIDISGSDKNFRFKKSCFK